MIYLYVKTHNTTGLKYLGKTSAVNPYSYKGSGKYWTNHIKKHGYNVTTEILFQSTDSAEIKQQGLHYSKLWNIVESKEWANLKEESGDGGWNQEIVKSAIQAKYGVSNSVYIPGVKEKLSSIAVGLKNEDMRKTANDCFKIKYGVDNPMQVPEFAQKVADNRNATLFNKYGVTNPLHIPSVKQKHKQSLNDIGHQQGSKNSQYGTMWITNGYTNTKIKKIDLIPDGWYKGRVTTNLPFKG